MSDRMKSIYDFADDIQTALNSEHLWVDDIHCQVAARILQKQGYRKAEVPAPGKRPNVDEAMDYRLDW